MFNFKKKLTADQAASMYLESLLKVISATWGNDLEEIIYFCDQLDINKIHPERYDVVKFEIMIAVIPLEFLVIQNLFPEKYIMLTQAVYRRINDFTTSTKATDYAIDKIQGQYIPQIEEVLRKSIIPWEGILTTLLESVGVEYSTIMATKFIEIMNSKIGGWKIINETYKIVK